MSEHALSRGQRTMVGTNGIRLAINELGEGPPLIMLHGIGSRGLSWLPVVEPLAERFRLIVPDFRGHGDSDKPASGYQFEDYAADLAGLISALGLERPIIFGHSLGGIVATYWANQWPSVAATIVLEDTPLHSSAASAPMFDNWAALASMSIPDAAAWYASQNPDWTEADCLRRAKSITATHPSVFTELKQRVINEDGSTRIGLFPAIESPVLLVHGDPETGGLVAPADLAALAAAAPRVRIARMAGGTHFLHRDNPSEFLAIVDAFLSGVRGFI